MAADAFIAGALICVLESTPAPDTAAQDDLEVDCAGLNILRPLLLRLQAIYTQASFAFAGKGALDLEAAPLGKLDPVAVIEVKATKDDGLARAKLSACSDCLLDTARESRGLSRYLEPFPGQNSRSHVLIRLGIRLLAKHRFWYASSTLT
ncbi:MAG: hypothetical protein ACTHNV_18320 [Ralstonia sp.]|uniref:hypothetical protein n=1 Tax=Ralstonia sp. TaxID=54061 RepID=UPI003F7ED61E